MRNKKSAKHSFILSLLSVLLCFSMLIGSTFAWFTDSASTNVNTIATGTLKVDLIDADGASVVGQTLKFADLDENDLWEPGCTYSLQPIRVKNLGSLALSYRIVITGISGDVKLNEAIEWKVNGIAVKDWSSEGALLPDEVSGDIVISGHMKEEAGNEYQGLMIDGIAITVYATQHASESDSLGNDYDKDAAGVITVTVPAKAGKDTVIETEHVNALIPAASTEDAALGHTIKVEKFEESTSGIYIPNFGFSYDISISNIPADNTDIITVSWNIGKDVTITNVYHDDVLMNAPGTTVGEADTYEYDPASGIFTIYVTHFSEFIFASDKVTFGKVAILSDSLAAYPGTIPEDYVTWYSAVSEGVHNGNNTKNDVSSVADMWWHKLMEETGSTMLLNESYAGTTIGNHWEYKGVVYPEYGEVTFVERMKKSLDGDGEQYDTIFILGGINDSSRNTPLGNLQFSDWTDEDLKSTLPSFCYILDQLRTNYPNARIINITVPRPQQAYKNIANGMIEACSHYDVDCIVIDEAITSSNWPGGHPNVEYMEIMKDQIIDFYK